MAQTLARCEDLIARREFAQHVAINAAKLVAMQRDPELRRIVEACELVSADGQAVVWASRLLGDPLPERVAGIDLMQELFALAERRGFRVFILGAKADVLEQARAADHGASIRDLQLVGTRDGYFTEDEEAAGRRGGAQRPARHPLRRHLLAAQGVLAGTIRADDRRAVRDGRRRRDRRRRRDHPAGAGPCCSASGSSGRTASPRSRAASGAGTPSRTFSSPHWSRVASSSCCGPDVRASSDRATARTSPRPTALRHGGAAPGVSGRDRFAGRRRRGRRLTALLKRLNLFVLIGRRVIALDLGNTTELECELGRSVCRRESGELRPNWRASRFSAAWHGGDSRASAQGQPSRPRAVRRCRRLASRWTSTSSSPRTTSAMPWPQSRSWLALGGRRAASGWPAGLHETLVHPTLPRVELHWRVHWYERRFAADALVRARGPRRRRAA